MSTAGTGRLVRIEEKMYGAKYREIVDKKKPAPENSGPQTGGKGSPSNRTTTLSTQPRQDRIGFRTSL